MKKTLHLFLCAVAVVGAVLSCTPGDGVMNIDDAGVQKMVEMRVMYPGDVILPYCKENLCPYR